VRLENAPPERLVAMLRSSERDARPRPECPPPDRLWDAARGELPARETRSIVSHTAACASCSADWRLALELGRDAGAAVAARSSSRTAPRLALLVAATLAGAAILVTWRGLERPEPSGFRTGPRGGAVRALIGDRAPLPRDAFVLRWEAPSPGSTYAVEVASEDLRPLFSCSELESPEIRVPRAALGSVPAGGIVIWRVRASLPGGRVVASPAFLATVVGAP
jgi:hypothetical protein